MKIQIQGGSLESYALKRRLLVQEDTLTTSQPDFIVPDEWYDTPVPHAFTSAFYGRGFIPGVPSHYFVRYWLGDWHPQTAVMIPIRGMMNENLGHETITGSAARFITQAPEGLFENPGLIAMLQGMKDWQGFVSIGVRHESVCCIHRGVPGWGVFGLLEGLKCRISSFLVNPAEHRFTEWWWYGSQLISRSPFPHLHRSDECLVEGVTSAVERHFWAFAPTGVMKESFKTPYTALGVATAWSNKIGMDEGSEKQVGSFLRRTSESIRIARKQYRTDFAKIVGRVWGEIKPELRG